MSSTGSIWGRLVRTRQALRGARSLLDIGDHEGACNRAYYAMYHAASAALLAAPASSSEAFKTHSGLVEAFHKTFVLPGKIDRELGRSLSRMLQMRLLADCSNEPPSVEDTAAAIFHYVNQRNPCRTPLMSRIEPGASTPPAPRPRDGASAAAARGAACRDRGRSPVLCRASAPARRSARRRW